MEIWIWIFISVALTAFFLRDKNIKPYNFLWALLPIEKYGIDVAGFILKPVYIFSVILIAYYIIKGKFRLKLPRYSYIMTMVIPLIVLLSLTLRGGTFLVNDLSLYLMFLFVIALAAMTMSLVSEKDDFRQIRDVLIYSAFAYGIVFAVLVNLYNFGVEMPAVWGDYVSDNSIMIELENMVDGKFVSPLRLRGFFNDANSCNILFLCAMCALFERILTERKVLRSVPIFAVYLLNIIYTSSRSALIITVFIVILYIFRFFLSRTAAKRKLTFIGVLMLLFFAASVFLISYSDLLDYFYSALIKGYERSSLTDELGRFSIWSESIAVLFEKAPFSGLGFNQLVNMNGLGRDAHNSFIEMLCASGILMGIYYPVYLFTPALRALKYRVIKGRRTEYSSMFIIIFLICILVNLTVSNVLSQYMIYMMFLIVMIPRCIYDKTEAVTDER